MLSLNYDLNGYKSEIKRHLLNRFFLNRYPVCFNLFVLTFLVTPCLLVAVRPCMEWISIRKRKKKISYWVSICDVPCREEISANYIVALLIFKTEMYAFLFFIFSWAPTSICHFFHPSVHLSVPCTPYLRNRTSSNHNFWYTCVKWWYLGVFFIFLKFLFFGLLRG